MIVQWLRDSGPTYFERRRGLDRFKEAQRPIRDQIKKELIAGRKVSHWMWFVFPQAKGLGTSRTSRVFALSPKEARAYRADDELANFYAVCTMLVLHHLEHGLELEDIFGGVDAQKFRSSMELFRDLP